MSGAADLMPRIEEARSGHQRAEELLSEAKGMLGHREEAPKPQEEGGGWLDKLKGAGHTLLDAAGFIPVVGAAADLANAAWYAAEGDYTNAAFSAASAVPGVGDAFAAGKVAVKVAGATGGITAAAAFVQRGSAVGAGMPSNWVAKMSGKIQDWAPSAAQHIFKGNFNGSTGQLAGGLHTQAALKDFLTRNSKRPEFTPIQRETLSNGVERVTFQPDALTKKAQQATAEAAGSGRGVPNGKTIFPANWNDDKIVDALNQAKDGGNLISPTKWGGELKELEVDGVKVEVAIDQFGKLRGGYPSWNQ